MIDVRQRGLMVGIELSAEGTTGVGFDPSRRLGYEVRVGRFNFGNLAKPRILGHPEGFVKVVSEARHDEVLGVHIVGPHATDLISEACLGLQL